MKKATIRKIAITLAVLMAVLTAVYIAYAATPKNGADFNVYAAFLYEGQPDKWYYPSQLGITEIIDYGAGKNATWLHVVAHDLGVLRVERPIFKWEVNGKFYQISYLHVTPGSPASPIIQPVALTGVGCGWFITGVLFWKSRRLEK